MSGRYSAILRLGAPILVGQAGMIVVGFADNIMVGNYMTDALSAASFVNNIFNVVLFACIGFTYGLTPLIGALYSQKRHDDIGATLRRGIRINMLFALAMTALMTVVYFNLHRLGQPESLMPLIRPYYLLYLCGIIPVTLFNVMAQWSYACKNTSMPMWIILIANCINVSGNYLLITGNLGCPELGLTGAGIATLAARIFCPAAILCIFALKGGNRIFHNGFRHASSHGASTRHIMATSVPVALQMTFETGSFSLAAIMSGWLGKLELASFQIIIIVGSLGFCIYYSVASAVSVLVANAAGRDDNHEMRAMAWSGYHIMLVLMVAASVTFVLFGRGLFSLFSPDPTVIGMTATLIVPLVLYQLGDATQITFAGALRGTSRVMPMVWISFISYVMIGIPSTYLLAFTAGMGIQGIVYSFSASLFPAGAMFLYYFLRTTRNRQTVARAQAG